jgi:hypothetical protein
MALRKALATAKMKIKRCFGLVIHSKLHFNLSSGQKPYGSRRAMKSEKLVRGRYTGGFVVYAQILISEDDCERLVKFG